ncbi:copper amine oxidase domain protein [Paenibacillus curdlanolyticus YK9]|uniref:Copper amine oxidase domain protein n=1 Tax=Paenibacillus curdlanolyticus YK9 TaxID=717606 RepID=E0ICM2_9BACL|nr:stalk domain-containing protein [Paenibacillus curdlanolyticus]EFM09908.1 copper amine oxidase domain protein [Paenibacillus curdlanolyticus YK9]
MKTFKWLLLTSLLLSLFTTSYVITPPVVQAEGAVTDMITMNKNSKIIVHNGVSTTAAQPLTFIKGVSYIPLKAIAVEYGYKVTYDAVKKDFIATLDNTELRLKANSTTLMQNGTKVTMSGPAINQAGSFMVPVKAWANLTGSKLTLSGTVMNLTWSKAPTKATAAFEVLAPSVIYAQQTTVTYVDKSFVPDGSGIQNEVWDGRMDIFPEPGTYTITHQIQDGNGVWSDPYSVTIEVKAPNQPPVADFTIEKQVYRIGENVIYTDRSTDDENAIAKTTWTGNNKAFFAAGDYPVTLEVQDNYGLTSTVTKIVSVSNEVLYTEDEYGRLFTAVGERYKINGSAVKDYPAIATTPISEPAQMVRSNSPETWTTEGIAYDDQLLGEIRFMFHNQNNIGVPVRMYLLATNLGDKTANVGVGATGIGGPNPQVAATGKMSAARYLAALNAKPATTWMTVKPGETKEVLPIISKAPIKQDDVFSAFADLVTDQRLQFQIVVVQDGKDPVATLPSLSYLSRDTHVRGTFNGTNRTIEINSTIGHQPQRIVIGDGKSDTFQDGYDGLTGNLEVNRGNFGVLYKMKLMHVAPRTLISLNPRGGYYMGAFLVNGNLVTLPASGTTVKDANEAGVLYRTGESEEAVEIVFTIAPGGNLPINMVFTPLPEIRW